MLIIHRQVRAIPGEGFDHGGRVGQRKASPVAAFDLAQGQDVDPFRDRAATEAFRRRFFAGHTGPDEYNSLAELPPIPPSFDEPAGEDTP